MLLQATNIKKTYGKGHTALTVIDGLSFDYNEGEVVGIYGPSGSGKSTLLHMIGGLDRPTEGEVFFNGESLYSYSEKRLAKFRNRSVGFVFQFYHLLPEFSALENVMIPCLIAGVSRVEALEMAADALEKVGLKDRVNHRPVELSGGEQQRVAISRAIIMKPKVLLADEPTGNLDKSTGNEVMNLLLDLNKKDEMGIIIVTHDSNLISAMDKKMELVDGKLC